MANSASYPQIPSTVWSGVWKILHESPTRRVDENVLAIELGVQKTASKQYMNELTRLGLFGEDGATTDLAKKWRQDGDDPATIGEILKHAYPQDLRDLAPLDRLDRDKIVRWFVAKGLGSGAAKNKAATYIRIASGVSAIDAPKSTSKATKATTEATGSRASAKASKPTKPDVETVARDKETQNRASQSSDRQKRPELNVNVQIHISADSSKEQIDAIFSAMRTYFDGSSAAE